MSCKKPFGWFATALLVAVAAIASIEPGRTEGIRVDGLNIPAVSIDDARKDALGYCASGTSAKCSIVNINNKPAE